MPTNILSRGDVNALIPVEEAAEIAQAVTQESTILRLGRRLRDMTSLQRTMPVLDALPMAYFVNGEAGDETGEKGLKRTTRMAWRNKVLHAEEIAVIVPIPENVLDDSQFPIWTEVVPHVRQAIGQVIDGAIMFGANAPSTWPGGLVPSAQAAGNTVTAGTGEDLYDDILGVGGTYAAVEADGYMVSGNVAHPTFMAQLRGLRDGPTGQPLFQRAQPLGQDVQTATRYDLAGVPVLFQTNGAYDDAEAALLSGDFSQLVYSIRKDISFKILTEAVISDADGKIILNLAQQDSVAMRVVMRLAWQLPNPLNPLALTEGGLVGAGGAAQVGRYPFAVLRPAGWVA